MTFNVYTTPGCVQCDMTIRWLTKNEAEFSVIDLSASEADMEAVKSMGYSAAPVVVDSDGDHWSGFRPDKLLLSVNKHS